MMHDDDDKPIKRGDKLAKQTRDARGRWLKGHCPNPNGRPKKRVDPNYDPGDIRHFGNTVIEITTNGRVEMMDRRTALLHKMFETAMKGRVSMQRFLHGEFERNDVRLARARLQYQQLMTDWVIENPDFDGIDGDNIPFEVQLEILGLQSLLNHYFPSQYPKPPRPVRQNFSEEDED
jgi:hypothetical protein